MTTLSAVSDWVCGACAYHNKGGKFCTMCAIPHPKRHAVLAALAADMPVAAAAAPAPIVAASLQKHNKLLREKKPPQDATAAPANMYPPQGAVAPANMPPPAPAPAPAVADAASAPVVQAKANGPFHLTGVVVEIVGTEMSDQGHSCEEHLANCGEVMANNVMVHLRKVQIMVEGQEEMVIAAMWINDGIDRCCVGFLPCHMVAPANRYDGAVAQVIRIFSGDPTFCDSMERRMFHKNKRCCIVAIIAWPSPRRDTASD
jgi:hypothetical protein